MDAAQLQAVRRFNRAVALGVGALEDGYLRRGRPLAAARLLHEVGENGAELRAVRERLRLDSGHMSRLLRALEAEGLVRTGPGRDRRARFLALTPKGRAERAAYDALSDDLAASFLRPLDERQRERLLAAMAEVERLLRAGAVELRDEPADGAAARQCLRSYFAELDARFDGGFRAPEIDAEAAELAPPRGRFLVARSEGVPIGCGALRLHGDGSAEVKRLWTAPDARGLGVARRVLRALEARARDAGAACLRLDTHRALAEAQSLYRAEGFREVPRFNNNPHAHHWFEKAL